MPTASDPTRRAASAESTRRGLLGRIAGLAGMGRRRAGALAPRRHDPQVSFGRSPSLREIEVLARRSGFRALLNLNTEGESGEHLSPNVEASWAHAFAMQHERVSIDLSVMRSEWVDRFLETLQAIARPVYVHSLGGRRAAVLMAVQLALERGLTGAEALVEARRRGLEGASRSLEDFLVAEVDLRARAGAAPA